MTPKEKIAKLEDCIKLQEGIIRFARKIDLYTEYLNGFYGEFYGLRVKYTHNIDIYKKCIVRLKSRYNKIIKEL